VYILIAIAAPLYELKSSGAGNYAKPRTQTKKTF